jgi:hypothetical protein
MGKLSGIMDGMNSVKQQLDEADTIKNHTNEYLNKRFDESDERMSSNMKAVLKEQSEQAVFASAVNQTVLQVAQNNQVMLHNMINDLKLLEREINKSTKEINKDFRGNLDGAKKDIQTQMSKTLTKISADIANIPTEIPEPEKTDLSPVITGVKAVLAAIKAIPEPKIPKPVDVMPTLQRLEKKIDKRAYTFDIERENDLIKKVTVRTK